MKRRLSMAVAAQKVYIKPGEQVFTTCCPGTGDHNGCTLFTFVKNGQVTRVERARYPNGQEGIICVRGLASANLPRHPERLTQPLKRSGERGEGKWEEITWEQAFDEIAAMMQKLKDQYGGRSVAILTVGSSHAPFSSIHSYIGVRFANLFGATDYMSGIPIDNNVFAANHFDFGTGVLDTFTTPDDLLHSKYIVLWGGNYAEASPKDMKGVIEAKARGAKVVDIGVIYDQTAAASDEFIAVKPGSDAALILSLIQVMLDEDLYDGEYMRDHTNAPFLVREDNGMFLRASEVIEGGDSSHYLAWDEKAGQAKAVAPGTYQMDFQPALTGSYQVAGIACKPAFQLLKEHAGEYPPEKTQPLTDVPAETVCRLAREMAATKPMSIATNMGMRYWEAYQAYRGMNLLAALTGNYGLPGGGRYLPAAIAAPIFNVPGVTNPTDSMTANLRWDTGMKAMETGEPYPVKGFIIIGNNPLNCTPNRNIWLNQRFPNLDLIVVNDIFMTDTAQYADYVLPDATVFERNDIDFQYGCVVFQQKAIEPPEGVLNRVEMWSELARRLELGEYFEKNDEEWIDVMLRSEHPFVKGITVAELKANGGMVPARVPVGGEKAFRESKFPTASGRLEFYSEYLVPIGDALFQYKPSLESSHARDGKEYPLTFLSRRKRFRTQSLFANDPSLQAIEPTPALDINPLDAEVRGIHNGDLVRVFNNRGEMRSHARLTENVPVGMVNFDHGWFASQQEDGHYEELILDTGSDSTYSEAHEVWWNRVMENQIWWEVFFAGRPDILWDCAVEVEKAQEVPNE
jgi:anaerobic selenocysteine-containing dehydrogenase